MDDYRDSRSGVPPGQRRTRHLRTVGSVPGEQPSDRNRKDGRASGDLSPGDLFAILWQALADILGTAAAATLLRRAAQRAWRRWPELADLTIVREGLEYRYEVPAVWNDSKEESPRALRELTRELWTLLVDLTGAVVVNRLAQIPELRDRGIIPEQEKPA